MIAPHIFIILIFIFFCFYSERLTGNRGGKIKGREGGRKKYSGRGCETPKSCIKEGRYLTVCAWSYLSSWHNARWSAVGDFLSTKEPRKYFYFFLSLFSLHNYSPLIIHRNSIGIIKQVDLSTSEIPSTLSLKKKNNSLLFFILTIIFRIRKQ